MIKPDKAESPTELPPDEDELLLSRTIYELELLRSMLRLNRAIRELRQSYSQLAAR